MTQKNTGDKKHQPKNKKNKPDPKPYIVRDSKISSGGSYILKNDEYTKQEQKS